MACCFSELEGGMRDASGVMHHQFTLMACCVSGREAYDHTTARDGEEVSLPPRPRALEKSYRWLYSLSSMEESMTGSWID